MEGMTQDRYRVTVSYPNGTMVTIMSQKEIERFCEKNNCMVQTNDGLIDVSEFKFGYKIKQISRYGATIVTPEIYLKLRRRK